MTFQSQERGHRGGSLYKGWACGPRGEGCLLGKRLVVDPFLVLDINAPGLDTASSFLLFSAGSLLVNGEGSLQVTILH